MNQLHIEFDRRANHRNVILATLRQRTMSLSELRAISANHTARISELRNAGHNIVCHKHGSTSTYRLEK